MKKIGFFLLCVILGGLECPLAEEESFWKTELLSSFEDSSAGEMERLEESTDRDLWAELGYGQEEAEEYAEETDTPQRTDAESWNWEDEAWTSGEGVSQLSQSEQEGSSGSALVGVDNVLSEENARREAAIEMEGEAADADGHWYYRADNCSIRILTAGYAPEALSVRFDGTDVTSACTITTEADGVCVFSVTAEQTVSFLKSDGEHRIEMYYPDESGGGMAQVAFKREGETGNASEEGTVYPMLCTRGVEIEEGAAAFVLDRSSPRYTVEISAPEAARQKVSKQGNRYYFNSSFMVQFHFSDDHLDLSRMEIRRGYVGEGNYNSKETEILSFPERIAVESPDVLIESSKDGVYRYQVSGCDKAGNPPVCYGSPDAGVDGRTRHIVVEHRKPEGQLTILSGDRVYYSLTAEGGKGLLQSGGGEKETVLLLETDAISCHTPVKMRCEVETTKQEKKRTGKTNGYVLGAGIRLTFQGQQCFRVKRWVMTDLAGNEKILEMPEPFLLDPEKPVVRIELPESGALTGRGERIPLYRGEVSLNMGAEDAGEGKGGSGLAEVICEIATEKNSERRILFSKEGGKAVYSWSGSTVISASSFESNRVQVTIRARDEAGNEAAVQSVFAIDVTAPELTIRFEEELPTDSLYVNHPCTAQIEVRDANFDPDGVFLSGADTAEAGEWYCSDDSAEKACYSRKLLFREEGEYQISCRAVDLAGNSSQSYPGGEETPFHFILDQTPPKVTAEDVEGEMGYEGYWRSNRRIKLTVAEEHYGDEGEIRILRDGELVDSAALCEGTIDLLFEEEGDYIIEGRVTDLAGNTETNLGISPFVIDKTEPEICLEGAEEGSANPEPPSILATVTDVHLAEDSMQVTLARDQEEEQLMRKWKEVKGGYRIKIAGVKEDGIYHIRAEAEDLAGNRREESLSFSVNQKGTVFESEQKEGWSRSPVKPSYLLHDVDEVTILSCSVNGEEQEYEFANGKLSLKEALTADGVYKIGIETMDRAGHRSAMKEEEIRIDGTPPALRLSGLDGSKTYYFEPVELTLLSDDPAAEYVLLQMDGKEVEALSHRGRDGQVILRADTFGEHVLKAKVRDPAGNESETLSCTFIITDDPLLKMAGNPWIVAAALAAAAGAGILLWRKRHASAES